MIGRLYFLISAVFFISEVSAQQITHSCGYDHWLGAVKELEPARAANISAEYNSWVREAQNQGARLETVYQIPVVFHIVWNTAAQNLPDSVIHSQIEVLNEDYRRLNADAELTRPEFLPVAADVEIEFQLATIDPDGNPTNGIVRHETAQTGWALDLFAQVNTLDYVKMSSQDGSDAWDTEHYLNIWVCNIEPGLFGQVFGLAYPPNGAPNWPANSAEPSPEVSGVIVHYTTVGRNNPSADDDGVSDNNYGRTCTHEIGHYLGLRHIWGDGFFNGCNADDGLADTPNSASADNYACNLSANTCTDAPIDFNDMIENFMDYSKETCQNVFTQEQAAIMRMVLEAYRPGLIEGQVGLGEHYEKKKIILYPNPAGEYLTLDGGQAGTRVSITDNSGRTLMQQTLNGQNDRIAIGRLVPGFYLLRASNSEKMTTLPFIKQ